LAEPLVGGLPRECTVRSLEIVEVLPLLELDVEDLRVVDDLAGEHAVELLIVDAMRTLDLAVEPGG